MNNTTRIKTLSIVAIFIAATLVLGVGTFAVIATTQSAFAYSSKKKGGDNEGNGNTNTPQEINSESNAVGFDATSENEPQNQICTHPNNNDGACSEKEFITSAAGNNTVPVVKLTCEECFKKFLTPDQINQVIGGINPAIGVSTVEDLCAKILSGQLNANTEIAAAFVALRGDVITVNKLVACLQEAGIDVHKVISTS